MSELKVIDLGNIRESIEKGESVYYEYYPKSEADKVIAELKESYKDEVKQLLILNSEQANAANMLRDSMEQVIFHHKYKRCLAMAQWCMDAECKTEKDADFLVRWEYRWLALAEEPTWAKFLQLIRKEAK